MFGSFDPVQGGLGGDPVPEHVIGLFLQNVMEGNTAG
jgi:hypothetical protein